MGLIIATTKNELCRHFPDITEEEIDTKKWIAHNIALTRTRPNKTNVEVGEGSLTESPLIGQCLKNRDNTIKKSKLNLVPLCTYQN